MKARKKRGKMLKRTIRKFTGGGLGNLGDINIPMMNAQVYVRTQQGETFYVPTLMEGILHLLSEEGYRLSVIEWPDGAGFGHASYEIVIRRKGDEISTELRAPMLDNVANRPNMLVWELDKPSITPAQVKAGLTITSIEEVMGIPKDLPPLEEITQEVEVRITGT